MNLTENKISDQEIERSLWYIKNKNKIKKIIIIFLISLIAGLYGFAIFKFINIKITDYNTKDYQWASLDFTEWRTKNTPQELIVISKDIIKKPNNYDLVIGLKNPNEKILAQEVKYKFIYNDKYSKTQTTLIKPQETKKLIIYNIDSDKIIRQIDIEIEDVSWKRLDSMEQEKIAKELFQIDNKKINIDNKEQSRNWVEFDVKNISPYNLVNTKFYTLLYLGQKLIAVNQIEENNFLTGEKRNLETSWFYKLSPYANLQVEYESNPLNEDNIFIITK